MLKRIVTGVGSLDRYRSLLPEGMVEDLYSLGIHLKGARVAHINATANGGGVAEILRSIVPLYRALGVDASWLMMQPDEPFFKVTKQLHNALQGADCRLTQADWDVYMERNRRDATSLTSNYDVVFLHDPQSAAMREFARGIRGPMGVAVPHRYIGARRRIVECIQSSAH